ncbi:trissin receptor, partial [Hyalella azteca]|uniref:Trissin receptor n=1 Tax=Hyalella azteca TaxID=294128 RepID=A0A8B7PHV5_HYAAZ
MAGKPSFILALDFQARNLLLMDDVLNSSGTLTPDIDDAFTSSLPSSLSTFGFFNASQDTHNSYLDSDSDFYIFNEPRVKIPLLVLYSLVFILAFFGNLLVVLVMTLHRRMRSHTNFFLTNLAVADLGVAVFCVYQNFAMYVIHDWYLGQFLCLMYHFVTSLSCTASVIILVAVSGERYLAIVEPLRAKSLLTRRNMVTTMVLVWAFSALYSCPRLLYFEVAEYPVEGGKEAMCILRRDLFDTKIWDVVSLILLFLLPLLLLTILYLRIAHVLCASSKLLAQVSYSETGKFIRTSPRPSASVTGRGCFCSTKQEFLSTISVTNGKRGSQGNSNVENCPAFSPALLNAVNNTAPAKSKRFQGFKLAKRWKKSTSKQLEHQ